MDKPAALYNTEQSWGGVAKSLHWTIAVLILFQFPLGWAAVSWRLSPTKLQLFIWHKSIGILVLALAAGRLLWRLSSVVPRLPSGMALWEQAAARIEHLALYILTLALPFSGWIIDSAANIPFKVFWLFRLPAIASPSKLLEETFKEVHWNLAVALAVLLAVHVGAAFWHHYVRNDEVLRRMLPGGRSRL